LHALAARGISVLVSTHYMDEAERCHKLAYIAFGKLMAQGTADEIIEGERLTTWAISDGLERDRVRLRGEPGIDHRRLDPGCT
jgi:ABC-2 type transport system ATP-binding protein